MTLLSDDGLDATYLAADLRQPRSTRPLVTQPEDDERRRAIIDSVRGQTSRPAYAATRW
jgi:hypothetical protein